MLNVLANTNPAANTQSVAIVILISTYASGIVKGCDEFCPLQNVYFPIIVFSGFSAESPCAYCTDHTVPYQIQMTDLNFY